MSRLFLSFLLMIVAIGHATAQTGGLMVRQLARPAAAASAPSGYAQKERTKPVVQQPLASASSPVADGAAIQQLACFKRLTELSYEQLRSSSRRTDASRLTCAR